jgi:Leucine-rich repeat (LRR) protein
MLRAKRPRTEPPAAASAPAPSTAWDWAPHEPASSAAEESFEYTLTMSTAGALPGANEWEDRAAGGPARPIELPAVALGGSFALHSLCMRDQGLTNVSLPASMWGLSRLVSLNLSRNRLELLPPGVGGLTTLQTLDISRNRLKELPKELGALRALVTLSAQSNHLRPAKRSLPLAELGQLLLRSIDLCFNQKLKAAAGLLAESVPQAQAVLAGPPPKGGGGG